MIDALGCQQRLVRNLVRIGILLVTCSSFAYADPLGLVVHASKSNTEAALHKMQAYAGGRLPILNGFVEAGSQPLENYEQGYYEYAITVTSLTPTESRVSVSAKITAWYKGSDASKSGYQELPSSGRLETDLLRRLEQALSGPSSSASPHPPTDSAPRISGAVAGNLPDSPSVSKSQTSITSGLAPSSSAARYAMEKASSEKLDQLSRQLKGLEAVLKNQVTPDDLVSVVANHTPVQAQPGGESPVILYAEAGDELQVLDLNADWVHVQLPGPARGWIRKTQLDLSGLAARFGTQSQVSTKKVAFQKTRQETGVFPGDWSTLRGKNVEIIWVQPNDGATSANSMKSLEPFLREHYAEYEPALAKVSGLVLVVDSSDGGMVATTVPELRRWHSGRISNESFWKQCWFDPPDAFTISQKMQ